MGTFGEIVGLPTVARVATVTARLRREAATAGNLRMKMRAKVGGPPGDRTRDTLIKSQVLYH
jgi:hypothetical protein